MANAVSTYLRVILAPFGRVHALFVSGSALAMLFPIISAPIVARLYSPNDFGVYAVFYSLSTILAAVSSLELRHVAMLEPTRDAGAQGVQLALSAVVAFTLLLVAGLVLVPQGWLGKAFGTQVVPFLNWLPLTVLLIGASQVLYTWATREKEYRFLARNKLILGGATMTFQISIGMMQPGPVGFIAANLLGLLLINALLLRLFLRGRRNMAVAFGFASAKTQFLRHHRLTIWTMPGALINTLSQFLPDLLINSFFGAAQLGQYSLAMRMLNLPISFLSNSIQEFFRQQSSEEFNTTGQCRGSFWRFLVLTTIGAIVLILPVVLLMPIVFPFIFGTQWTAAGTLVQAVALLVMIRFVSSPLSYIWIVRGQQKLDFLWQLGLLSISFAALSLPSTLAPGTTLFSTLQVYGLSVGAWYLVCIAVSFHFSRPERTAVTKSRS
jgi:O-antigen/teichoic acid export membrane protein